MTNEQKIIAYKEFCKQNNLKESHADSLNEFYKIDSFKQEWYRRCAEDEAFKFFCERTNHYTYGGQQFYLYDKYNKHIKRLFAIRKEYDELVKEIEDLDKYSLMYKANENLIDELEYTLDAVDVYFTEIVNDYETNDCDAYE